LAHQFGFEPGHKGHLDLNTRALIQLQQYGYNGKTFQINSSQTLEQNEISDGLSVLGIGMSNGIPSGDDLLTPLNTGQVKAWNSGIARWRRGTDGTWKMVSYKLVQEATLEASLIRDLDGTLLMLCRPWFPTNKQVDLLQIHRSTDEGETWEVALRVQPFWQGCPMTLNRAADGTPYIALNRYREPVLHANAKREMIWLWPLSADRSRLLEPIVVRDATRDFGPPYHGSIWRVDHATGTTVRLADGQWHHVLCYRGMEDAEMRTEAGATPMTGCYVEEVFSKGPPLPTWQF
jgi:hypothetical protein